jgi:hypothetical protein
MADVQLLPPEFSFSQSSLQAYVDCARRFWLAYVEQLPWPAVEASPIYEHEELMRMGATFHRLVERSEIGIAPDQVAARLVPPLSTWFDAYLTHRPADLPRETVEVERVLAVPFVSKSTSTAPAVAYRLVAKYDLIAADRDGRVVIVDWKTARRRSDPSTVRQRIQSVVYPFVLVEASASLPWGPVRPEQVEMRYWFAAAPTQPIVFRYDAAQHDANRQFLQQLLAAIVAGDGEASFPKVLDTETNRRRLCAYCIYRSRCNRGQAAGDLDALDDAEEFFAVDVDKALEFTLDDVVELAF